MACWKSHFRPPLSGRLSGGDGGARDLLSECVVRRGCREVRGLIEQTTNSRFVNVRPDSVDFAIFALGSLKLLAVLGDGKVRDITKAASIRLLPGCCTE